MKHTKDKKKRLALWIDHTTAYLIRIKDGKTVVSTIESDYDPKPRIEGEKPDGGKVTAKRSTNNEYKKHRKQENQLGAFYKELTGKVQKYHIIYLFGPGTAKNELLNHIRKEASTDGKTFIVDSADTLTFPQMVARAKSVLSAE